MPMDSSRRRPRARRPRCCAGGRLLPALLAGVAAAGVGLGAPPARAEGATTRIEVIRIKPKEENLATLRFLRENRAFFRAALDRIRTRPGPHDAAASEVDPSLAALAELRDQLRDASHRVVTEEEAFAGRDLLASVTELGELEAQLDRLEDVLDRQAVRLSELEADFTAGQKTSLVVLLRGYPSAGELAELTLTLGTNETVRVPFSAAERRSLGRGAVLEALRERIEPREQWLEISVAGTASPDATPGFIRLDPPRDQITFLQLDLTGVSAQTGTTGIGATTWVHEAIGPVADRAQPADAGAKPADLGAAAQ